MTAKRPVPPTGVGGVTLFGFPHHKINLVRLLLVGISVSTYINSLSCDFVFDDVSAIRDNRDIRPSSPWKNIVLHDFWGTDMKKEHSHKSYRPLTVLSFRLNYLLNELDPGGYHLVNLVLHSIVCILYHNLVMSLFEAPKSELLSFLSSMLFAMQPIHTEAVTGVVGRAELLSSIFFILAIIEYKKISTSKSATIFQHFCLPILTLLAMLSKEQGITVLGVCFIYEVFVVQRFDASSTIGFLDTKNNNSTPRRKMLIWTKSFLPRVTLLTVTGLLLLFIRFKVMGSSLPVFTNFDNPASYEEIPTKPLTWSYLIAVNVMLLLSPTDLCCDWTMKTIPLIESLFDSRNCATLITFVIVFLLGLMSVFGMFSGRKSSSDRLITLMGLSLLSIPFLPASNLFFPVGFVVAERVLYIPSMGFCMLVAFGAVKILSHTKNRLATQMALMFLFATHGSKTILRNLDWKNDMTIFTSGIAVNPMNAKLWNNVGHAFEASGDFDTALKYFQNAAKVQPDDVGAHINVGRTFNNLERFKDSEAAYLKAKSLMPQAKPGEHFTARIAPQHLSVYLNLGNLLAKDPNRLEEADLLYRKAISMRADYIQAYINRGDVLIKMGRNEEATEVYKQALKYDLENPDLYYNLGVVYIERGDQMVALDYFNRALSFNPDHIQALTNSAVLIQETGRSDLRPLAYKRLFKVLNLAKTTKDKKVIGGLERIYFNLGMLGMDDGNTKNTEVWFKQAIDLKPDFRSALFNLALLLNEQKRPLEAFPFLQQLMDHFPNHIKGLILLGDIYTNHLKDVISAERCYLKIIEIDPNHIQGKHNLCVIMVEQGRLLEAHECLKEVEKMAPNEKYIRKHLQIVETRIRASKPKLEKASNANIQNSVHR